MPAVDMAEIHLGQLAAAQIDDHQPASMGQKRDLFRQIVTTDDIDHHINAAPVGAGTADVCKVLGPVIDGVVRAQLAHGGTFLVSARGGEHGGAMGLCDLDGGAADAACAALDQNAFAGCQPAPVHHVGPDRAEHLGQAGSLDQRETIGDRHALAFGCQRVFRIAAADQQRADRIANAKTRAAFSGRGDNARDLQSHDVRRARRHRVFPFAFAKIGPIDPRRVDPDQHLASFGNRHIACFRSQRARAARRIGDDGRHAGWDGIWRW